MRDRADNVVIVCSIENVDPMGVHTGDSVCVAPQQTLTDQQYQALRDQAIAAIRAVGVETGGSNVQFAVNRATDEIVVIEMNPRVSRSSALASKATGFPIAKIAARLAVGYTLDEIPNDITRATPASFEPAIDYCVVKWPRFAFEKFPGVDPGLTTHMKSVGEVMAIGRTFKQAFAKAMRSRELDLDADRAGDDERAARAARSARGRPLRPVLEALRRGVDDEEVHARTGIDPWFLRELAELVADPEAPFAGERTFKAVDTCAAEFAAETPYYYSGWERPGPTARPRGRSAATAPSVVILGSGPEPDRPGDRVRLLLRARRETVRESGRDAVMVNCNPETVSTDYDTSDRLYFEPLTLEDVLGVVEVEQPEGVIVQFGGQTPLKLAAGLRGGRRAAARHQLDAIDLAEDRARFGALLDRLGYKAPPYATAHSRRGGARAARRASASRCSCAPATCSAAARWRSSTRRRARATTCERVGDRPHGRRQIFLDRFLEDAIEVDVDALCDGEDVWIAGIMQHVEEAGIHSGDSACVLPPHSLGREMLAEIARADRGDRAGARRRRADERAVRDPATSLYVIEANPRASRTVPFVSKAIGLPLAKLACRVMLGERIADLDLPADTDQRPRLRQGGGAAVRPLRRRRRAARPRDALDRRGDGHRARLPDRVRQGAGGGRRAAAQTRAPCSSPSPTATRPAATGIATIAPRPRLPDRRHARDRAGDPRMGIPAEAINKIAEGSPARRRLDRARRGRPRDQHAGRHRRAHRRLRDPPAAIARGIPCITTMAGGMAAARAIAAARRGEPAVLSLQELHAPRLRACVERTDRSTRARSAGAPPPITAHERHGAYVVLRCADPDGPPPQAGQFYMLAAASGGAGERTSGRSCRARSACCGPPRAAAARELRVPARGRRPRHQAPVRAARRRRLLLVGPLGVGLRAAARRARARCSSAAGSGSRRWRSGRTRSRAGRRRCSGFRDAAHAAGAALLRERASRHRRRHRRPPRARHRAARRRARRRRPRRGLRLRAAARCSRRSGRSAPSARCRAARARVGHGVRVRRLLRLRRPDPRRATSGCASTARCSTPSCSRPHVVAGAGH